MCLVDTTDGILMLGAYGWAYVHPIRKLYYNMTITSVSVLVAVLVGGIEVLNIIGDRFELQGPFWSAIGSLGDHFGAIGIAIILIFIGSWIASTLIYKAMGYAQLELQAFPVEADRPSRNP
jgi:high-affinity nickel-transport protein